MSVLDRVRALLGREALLDVAGEPDRPPCVAPDSVDAVALVLGTAYEEGWRVRVEGAGTWMSGDAPADLVLTTRRLDRVAAIAAEDLTATADGGVPLDALRERLAERGAWIALDPPGHGARTLGSVIATGTAGPLRQGFGPVRDHLLGLTAVTGDGRVVRSGGRVMKNVAGYDLTKLHAGGFGAFGVVVSAHLRLRVLPRADATFVLEAARDALMSVLDDVRATGLQPAAAELISPALARSSGGWILAIRLAGAAELVGAEEATLRAATGGRMSALDPAAAGPFWRRIAEGIAAPPVTLRVGGLPSGIDAVVDLLQHQLDDTWVSASAECGAVRWAGDAPADRLRHVRRALAALEAPLTLERAPWPLRRIVGHFGAYREGVGPLVESLRRAFDPGGRLVTAVSGAAGDT
jgi:glycolate oxidase FAD binding subunit